MKTLIYSNLFIALCAAILTLGTYGLIDEMPDPHLVLHVFGVTLIAYNVQRLVRMQKFSNRTGQIHWYLKNKWMLYSALLIGIAVSAYTFFFLSFNLLLSFAPLAILSFFYSVPIIPISGDKMAIRAIPGAKIFIIAFVWTGVTMLLPIQSAGVVLDGSLLAALIQRFFFILAITIPFDMRDLKYDDGKMMTLPQLLGYNGSKLLAIGLLVACLLMELFLAWSGAVSWQSSLWISAVYLLALAIVARATEDSSDFYFVGLVDGTMLLLGFAYMLT